MGETENGGRQKIQRIRGEEKGQAEGKKMEADKEIKI